MAGPSPQHVDVLIVGAGISGIGGAVHLQERCPGRTFAILEGRPDIGGTWDLFRYPGVRSDSDMHTLGFRFKPWKHEKSIADGPAILDYLRETVTEHDLGRHIRFGHRVTRAEWSSGDVRWTVTATRSDPATGVEQTVTMTCGFLYMCSGYYSYREGYTPEFKGRDRYGGTIIHPQEWPEDLDCGGKRVVVIGSGATAMTLIPAIADDVAHITMLQRSPTYVVSRPSRDVFANRLRRLLPDRLAYAITRKKNVVRQGLVYRKTRTQPEKIKEFLIGGVRAGLGPDYDVATHFTPTYNPWDQRLCLIPDGDLFKAIRSGKASVVTDHIDTFTETGIRLQSGEELEADIIVTATGLNLVTLGEMGLRGGRRAGRLRPDLDLQGSRLLRRAQPRVIVRVRQRLVDPEGGPHVGVRLSAPEAHGEGRSHPLRAAASPFGRRHAGTPLDRRLPGRLHEAVHAPAAPSGRPGPVAEHPGLRP